MLLPPLPHGGQYSGKIRLIEPQGVYPQETRAGCPQQRYATGEPGKVQGRDRVGIVERSRVKGPLGSVFGENLFYRETQGTRLGGRHVAKRSSDPPVADPEVKVRDLVPVLGVVAPFALRVSIWENLFYRAPGAKWAQETCAGCPPAAVRNGRARQSSGVGPCGYCRMVLWEPGPRGQ